MPGKGKDRDVDSMPGHGRAPLVSRSPSRSGIGRRLWLAGVGVLGIGIVASLLLAGGLFSNEETPEAEREVAPDFTLPTTEGSFTLSEHLGDVVILYFAIPGCPTCSLQAPALGKIQRELENRGVSVVAINVHPLYDLVDWSGYWRGLGASDVLWAQDINRTYVSYGHVVGAGSTVIIDREGRISYRHAGPTLYPALRAEVDRVL
ncbi:MAG: TlpA family protein disulfide reductase [Chloroflexi bacterium]|nr:TlpA family protein disulfide reductase [Chloroflexota bacterium]